MIELMFGDAKNPRPAPRSIMYTTSNGYGVDASGELADAQEFQIEERMGMPPLQEDEGREAGGRKDEEARDRRGLRYAIRGDGQREEQAEDEHGERDETAPVDRRPSFELRHLPEPEVGPGRPENPDRDVHVEQRAPVEDGEDDPADGQSRHGPHPERDLV